MTLFPQGDQRIPREEDLLLLVVVCQILFKIWGFLPKKLSWQLMTNQQKVQYVDSALHTCITSDRIHQNVLKPWRGNQLQNCRDICDQKQKWNEIGVKLNNIMSSQSCNGIKLHPPFFIATSNEHCHLHCKALFCDAADLIFFVNSESQILKGKQ